MNCNGRCANGSIIAGMGGFGVKAYDGAGIITPSIPERHIAAIQATEETTVESVAAAWDAPADVAGATIPAGACLFLKAESVTIASGTGFVYYGYGVVHSGGDG